jgi:DNA excision repair protein ERCC-4
MRPVIVIDTREQKPFTFSGEVETRRGTLAVGDYSLRGLEDEVAIERKSLNDLLGSITGGRERFIKELRQLRAFRFAAIVVEAGWDDVLLKRYPQNVAPNAVIGSLAAFAIKYGVVPILAGDRGAAAEVTERLLLNYARRVEKDYRALERADEAEGGKAA